MSSSEKLPDFGYDRKLTRTDKNRFRDMVVWPAIDHIIEKDFVVEYDPDEWLSVTEDCVDFFGEVKRKIRLEAGYNEYSRNGGEYFEARLGLLSLDEGITQKLDRRGETSTAWVVQEYIFCTDTSAESHSSYELLDEDGRVISDDDDDLMSSYEEALWFNQAQLYSEEYGDITKEEMLNVYLSLQILGVPEGAMNYHGWESRVKGGKHPKK